MKNAALVLGMVVVASVCTACTAKSASPQASPRISDEYAKAALKALDMIAVHTFNPAMQAQIIDAMMNADAEAVSVQETALTKKLNSIYEQERTNALIRRYLVTESDAKNARRINAAVAIAVDRCEEKYIQERDLYVGAAMKVGGDISLLNKEARIREEECEKRIKPPAQQRDEVPIIQEIDRREVACYKLFADALRDRSAAAPKECDSLTVETSVPPATRERSPLS